jgi:hypothetical protein
MTGIDVARLIVDFEYYCATCLKIRTKDRRVIPFNHWYPSQWLIWNSIKRDLADRRPVRKIILKPRQTGASTLTEAFLFWTVHTCPNTHALVLSMDNDSTRYIFDMARNFYENLPEGVKPMKRYSNRRELVFENPDEKSRSRNPGLRSRIEVQTAGKYVPPRGASFNLVHFSEVAFWPNATDIVPAIIPMVPDLPGTAIIYESTANGVDNFFYNEWMAARNGDSVFDPIFFPWTIIPEYSLPLDSDEEREEILSTLDEDEEQLLQQGVSVEQLKWRRRKIDSMHGDSDLFKQEYPATEQECWMFSGEPIFSRKILKQIKPQPPIWRGDIDVLNERLVPNDDGLLLVWEHPEPDAQYTIGVDTSSGTGADYSCMQVLKRTWPQGLGDQVAEWHGKVDPVALGQLAVILARHYNDAMLSIEINNHGLTTQSEAQRHYWNFYRWQYFDRIGRTYTQKIGWETNISTKPILIDRTIACLRSGLIGIRSEHLLREMWLYVRVPGTMTYTAESGHDDRVCAFMIAVVTSFIEDPDASFVYTEERPVLVKQQAPNRIGNVIMPMPFIDGGDPRGRHHTETKSWLVL